MCHLVLSAMIPKIFCYYPIDYNVIEYYVIEYYVIEYYIYEYLPDFQLCQ